MSRHNPSIGAQRIAIVVLGAVFGTSLVCQPLGATPFENYILFAPPGFIEGPVSPEYGLPSFTDPPLPGWDANADLIVSVGPIPPPTLDETTLILTIPINDTNTLVAHDTLANELGQLSLLATSTQKLDLNANNGVVDENAGTIQVAGGPNVMGYQPVTFSVLAVPRDSSVARL